MNPKMVKVSFIFFITLIAGCCNKDTNVREQKHEKLCDKESKRASYTEETYKLLYQVLNMQKQQLIDYMKMTQEKARSVCNDELMNSFFNTKKEFYYLKQSIDIPDNLVKRTKELCRSIEEHYVENYMIFYDILFIDTEGEIFYTIKKQKDYHNNIFSQEFKHTALSKMMQSEPTESFVDFQFYKISGEPSAFFIEPAKDNGNTIGWFVFQFAINKINSLFSAYDELGSTGEVLLVNKDHYMLTDSRFKAESTILKQKLADENIESKFSEGRGCKSVIDYRGNKVLSVFEVFEILGSEWLIIAKINESEAITNYYQKYEFDLKQKLTTIFSIGSQKQHELSFEYDENIMVDMDEFRRIDAEGKLFTYGISTCTAVIVSFPGRFSYLAHISPYDKIYGESKTDLLGQILKKVSYLEILLSEKQKMNFIVIAPHKKTINTIVEILLKQGFFLDQVTFISKENVEEAAIFFDAQKNEAWVQWESPNEHTILQKSGDFVSIGELFKQQLTQ
jgi:L-rhamnose mutarotase